MIQEKLLLQVNKKESFQNNKHIPVVLYVHFIHEIRINQLHTYQSTQYRILPVSPLTTCKHLWSFRWIYCCHRIIVYLTYYQKNAKLSGIDKQSSEIAVGRMLSWDVVFCCKLFIFFQKYKFLFSSHFILNHFKCNQLHPLKLFYQKHQRFSLALLLHHL